MKKILWTKITNVGVDDTIDPYEIKYVILLNNLALLAFFFSLFLLPPALFYLPESAVLVFAWFIGTPLCLVVPLLNYFKHFLVARIFYNLLGASAYISVSIIGGHELAYHYHLMAVMIGSFFIYPPYQKRIMYTIFLGAFLSFVGLEIWFLNHGGILSFSPRFVRVMGFSMDMVLIFFMAGGIYYSHTVYMRSEKKSEDLLHNILPVSIAKRLQLKPQTIADSFQNCSVLFADLVGFTSFSEAISPESLVVLLNRIFTLFDDLADRYGLEKIKTIGDSYMIVAGVPETRPDHAESIAEFALDIRDGIKTLGNETGNSLQLRIGICSGPAVAGVIGKKKFTYDLWGDTVNTASRMESHGVPGEIQVAASTRALLQDKFVFSERRTIEVKGKGLMETYFLKGRKFNRRNLSG